ncbi:MAG: hypothetical protein NBV68_09290 [Erythrobacter sp.]|uniref:hypothetical protein n=1 Tax=Erythrobacter sp. TaxID=1042 RepID=UPI0025EF595B|nr:hypothetical protein [Erythrobacter sp.]MCL9999564.1 hypothetical protein [Erythrobacter sp.]
MTAPAVPLQPIVPLGGHPRMQGLLDRWWAIALVCLIALAPLLVVEGIAPLTDLYGHLGRHAVQTGLAERPGLQPFFSYEWKLIGNLGGDILVQLFYPLLGVEGAVRATVIVTQGLGALGLLLVSREVHGRVTPFALAAIPLLYGFPFNYGFINYTLSMALALLAYVLWLRLRAGGREGLAAVWLGVAGAAIWVAHTYGWAFLGLLAGSTMLAEVWAARTHPLRAVGRILAACWPLLLPIMPMVIWRAGSSGAAISGWAWGYKYVWALSPLRTYWRDFDMASLAVLAMLLGWALRARAVRFDRRIGIAALLCLVFFIALPFRVFGSAFADMRLLPYALALALVAIGTARSEDGTLQASRQASRALLVAGAIALAFFGVRMASTTIAYRNLDRQVQAALPALDKMPKSARVAFFSVKPCRTRWALAPLDHLAGAAMARRDAFVNDQWQQPGVNPLKVSYPAAEPFVRDPSHLVVREECKESRSRVRLSTALARLPREAFTHIWIVGQYDGKLTPPPGFVEVPDAGSGRLYAATR